MPTGSAIARQSPVRHFYLTDKNRPYAQVIEERTDNTADDLTWPTPTATT
jgi:hypothetical protein